MDRPDSYSRHRHWTTTRRSREGPTKKEMKKAMPFISLLKQRLASEPADAVLKTKIDFDEAATVKSTFNKLKTASQTLHPSDFAIFSSSLRVRVSVRISLLVRRFRCQRPLRLLRMLFPGNPGVVFQNY